MCVCVCGLQVDVGNDTPSLFHFIPWGRVSQSNPNLTNMASLTNPLFLVSPVSTFPGWNWRQSATNTLNLCGPRDPNSSPYIYTARALTTNQTTDLILSTIFHGAPQTVLCAFSPPLLRVSQPCYAFSASVSQRAFTEHALCAGRYSRFHGMGLTDTDAMEIIAKQGEQQTVKYIHKYNSEVH